MLSPEEVGLFQTHGRVWLAHYVRKIHYRLPRCACIGTPWLCRAAAWQLQACRTVVRSLCFNFHLSLRAPPVCQLPNLGVACVSAPRVPLVKIAHARGSQPDWLPQVGMYQLLCKQVVAVTEAHNLCYVPTAEVSMFGAWQFLQHLPQHPCHGSCKLTQTPTPACAAGRDGQLLFKHSGYKAADIPLQIRCRCQHVWHLALPCQWLPQLPRQKCQVAHACL
jgi:hypothetical protein